MFPVAYIGGNNMDRFEPSDNNTPSYRDGSRFSFMTMPGSVLNSVDSFDLTGIFTEGTNLQKSNLLGKRFEHEMGPYLFCALDGANCVRGRPAYYGMMTGKGDGGTECAASPSKRQFCQLSGRFLDSLPFCSPGTPMTLSKKRWTIPRISNQ